MSGEEEQDRGRRREAAEEMLSKNGCEVGGELEWLADITEKYVWRGERGLWSH